MKRKFFLMINLNLILINTHLTFAQDEIKCKQKLIDSPNINRVLLLSEEIKKAVKLSNSKDNNTSKWMANKLSPQECKIILTEIEKQKISSALIPELLSVVDVVKSECGLGEEPKVVVSDPMPFSVAGSNLYYEWDDNNKLIVKITTKFDNEFIYIYSKQDLANGDLALTADQKKTIDSKNIVEITSKSLERQGMVRQWWGATKDAVAKIATKGRTDVYVPMIAYHDRNTYSAEKLKDLNEAALGIGIGKSIVNENGNTEMLFAMTHLDSHSQVEVNVGYGWQKNINITERTKVGIGYAAGLVSREDIANRIPVPFIFPMASIEYNNKLSLNGVLIPKLNGGINHGNVLFIFGKYSWDK